MNNEQTFALRRKRHLITASLVLDDNAIGELIERSLISKPMLENFKEESSMRARAVKYLELLEDNAIGIRRGAFERLCEFFESVGLPRINDELRVEVKTVRGELIVENYVRDEAHREADAEFGNIKRITAAEKQDLENVIAIRMQHNKEVWQREIVAAEQKLKNLVELIAEKEAHQERLLNRLTQYIRVNSNLNRKLGHFKRSISSITIPEVVGGGDGVTDEMKMNRITRLVTSLCLMTSSTLKARSTALNNKLVTLRVVGIDDVNAKLDSEVERRLNPIDSELKQLSLVLYASQQENAQLKLQIESSTENGKRRQSVADNNIQTLNERLESATRQQTELRNKMHQMELGVMQTKNKLNKYRVKATAMDRTRTKGYIDPKLVISKL